MTSFKTDELLGAHQAGWATEKLSRWMIERSFVTGHGDSVDDLLSELSRQIDERIQVERARCAEIVQMARCAEIDQDWRTVIHLIEGGMSVDQIKKS